MTLPTAPTESPKLDAQDIRTAMQHPAPFLNTLGWINDPNDPGRGAFRMTLWPWQWEMLNLFTLHQRIIILKARQLGVSWLLAGYALWLFLSKPGSVIIFTSKREFEAARLLGKARFLYDHLPSEVRFRPRKTDANSTTHFSSTSLGSEMMALAATPEAGRSETATLVVPDEWAFQPDAQAMYGGYEPTVGQTGQIIGASTANGLGGFFYDMWGQAVKGDNGFVPIFLPWHFRPGRTAEWREEKRREYESAGTPELLASEYPLDSLEAFQSSQEAFFPVDLVRDLLARIQRPLRVEMDGMWRIYEEPRFAGKYVIGADIGEGLANSNFSTATVLDAVTTHHVASFRGRVSPDLFGQKLALIGENYHAAMIAPEKNNHGIATIGTLKNALGYQNLYIRPKPGRNPTYSQEDIGWLTNLRTKPNMMIGLRQAMLDGSFTTPCSWLVNELPFFRKQGEPPRVTYTASTGQTDDQIISAGIAWAVRMSGRFTNTRGVRKTAPLSR